MALQLIFFANLVAAGIAALTLITRGKFIPAEFNRTKQEAPHWGFYLYSWIHLVQSIAIVYWVFPVVNLAFEAGFTLQVFFWTIILFVLFFLFTLLKNFFWRNSTMMTRGRLITSWIFATLAAVAATTLIIFLLFIFAGAWGSNWLRFSFWVYVFLFPVFAIAETVFFFFWFRSMPPTRVGVQ